MSSDRNKPPAFQFYADDFLAGTMDLSQQDVGAYIRLLCHQWNRGSIPVGTEKLARLAGGPVSDEVLAKFETGPDGAMRNARLESERSKQNAFRELQRKKGVASAQARLNRGSTAAEIRLQPNGNSPSPSPSPSPLDTEYVQGTNRGSTAVQPPAATKPSEETRKPERPTVEQAIAYGKEIGLPDSEARQWHDHNLAKGWIVGRVPMKDWRAAMRTWRKNWETFRAQRNGQHQAPRSITTPVGSGNF